MRTNEILWFKEHLAINIFHLFIRYYVTGEKAGEIEVSSDNLPGLPDNIQPASKGGYWVAFPMLRLGGSFDFLAENAWIRRFLVLVSLQCCVSFYYITIIVCVS